MFFEKGHSVSEIEFTLNFGKVMNFPPHLHRCFELFYQENGRTQVMIDGKKYELGPNEAVLVFPLQVHSYLSLEEGEFHVCIFSPEIVSSYYKSTHGCIPADNAFSPTSPPSLKADNILFQKSYAYHICAEFDTGRSYINKSSRQNDTLLVSLLSFADAHFRDECLLSSACSAIGYDYSYVSKYFKAKVGFSFREYVNVIRVNEAKRLLKNTLLSQNEIMDECGFGSLRTFDRVFRHVTGLSPSQYKKQSN